ncbi:MAG TPA: GTPase HflX [Candidatus Atribacteria bacterium]|nr:GTPase HflX [Candidatus Atribacteria bacterium]
MINGNIEGLSRHTLSRLEGLFDMRVERENFLSPEIIDLMCELTGTTGRELSVYLNRRGEVMDVSVGEARQVSLPSMSLRRSDTRLSGIRCIHTHPGGNGMLSRVDINALCSLRLDAMVAIGVIDGRFSEAYAAFLNPPDDLQAYDVLGPLSSDDLCGESLVKEIRRRDPLIGGEKTAELDEFHEERAVLIGLNDHGEGLISINELEELARTAGAKVVHKELQNRKTPEPATYIGRGKAADLALICRAVNANLVITDDELSATQMKNLEEILGLKVIDRTTLILDIFAKRAVTAEGKLQVELAQLKYRLPRLTGMGHALSRLGGGIGTRGPGEKKLETDRRHIYRRIKEIEEALGKVKRRRAALRLKREKDRLPVCALVGYTNTGKSTLLNALSGSDVLAENKLFATLDPVSRGIVLPDGRNILITDTVGFIDKLPHDLVQAFHSTLEEVTKADILLHVVDAGSPNAAEHMDVVDRVLKMLGANQTVITVYNKMDTVKDKDALPIRKPQVFISALNKEGLSELMDLIQEHLPSSVKRVQILLPYDQGNLVSDLHSRGNVITEEYVPEGVRIEAEIDEILFARVKKYVLSV